jgi:hypothetical protein
MTCITELIEQAAESVSALYTMRRAMSARAERLTAMVNALENMNPDELDRLQRLIRKMDIAANLDSRFIEFQWWKENTDHNEEAQSKITTALGDWCSCCKGKRATARRYLPTLWHDISTGNCTARIARRMPKRRQ